MLCEKCKKRTATVFYNETVNGKARAYSLCGECASKLRESGELQDITSMIGGFPDPFSMFQNELFGGFFGLPAVKTASAEKKCPSCSTTYPEIAKHGKVGCPACYETFADELSKTIQSVHGTTTHVGSVPSRHRAQKARAEQMKLLKRQLQESVLKEDYETAAALRDEIRQLENGIPKEEK